MSGCGHISAGNTRSQSMIDYLRMNFTGSPGLLSGSRRYNPALKLDKSIEIPDSIFSFL